jgi:hypothetical protein
VAYTDGKKNYSEAEVEDAPMWNAGSVYFDDEIVEYQSRYYIALSKTSAEVPGRSKQGKWKELVYDEDEVPFEDDSSLYDEELEITNEAKSVKEDSDTVPEKVNKPTPTTIAAKNMKPANKPLAKKQTLKERQEEKAKSTKISAPVETTTVQTMARKMTVAPSDQSIVNEVLKEMEFKKIKGLNTTDDNITTKLILPQKAKEDIKLTWESSHPDIISSTGIVTRPEDGQDVAVNLSLTVSKGKTSATRFFTLWAKALEKTYSDDECVQMVYDMLGFDQFKGKNLKADTIIDDLELLTHGLYDTDIIWACTNRDLLDETGKFYQNRLSEDTAVRLYAIIIKGEIEMLKHFDLTLKIK